MVNINNLSAEDANLILELSSILNIAVAKRLTKGGDRKFYVETTKGEKRLLDIGIMDSESHYWLKETARRLEYIATSGVNVSQSLDAGVFCEGTFTYQLFTWLDGEDLVDALPHMSHTEQFTVGEKCGSVARKIHTLPPLYDPEPWKEYFGRKVRDIIQSYNDKPESRSGDLLARYLLDNMELLDNRPQTFIKGDWNTENLILMPDGQIGVIDLGMNCGDPWIEFWEMPSDADSMAHFYTGQIRGYFGNEPPPEYFRLLSYYIALGTLEWYPANAKCVLNWFDNMRHPMPTWYLA